MVTTRSQHRAQASDPEPFAHGSPTPIDQTSELSVVDSDNGSGSDEDNTWISDPDVPPTYTIDLSLPPRQRYVELARDFKPRLRELTSLFDEVIELAGIENIERVRSLARWVLRRVYSKEQTEELRGISKTIDVEMYLLVALNTLLDLLMGCTSGAARTQEGSMSKMLHFRTLDWEMEELRHIVVNLEFIQSPSSKVIARSVTYVGFIGVLTGVRWVTVLHKCISFDLLTDTETIYLSLSTSGQSMTGQACGQNSNSAGINS